MRDKQIDYSETPPLDDEFFERAELREPEPKETVTIRIDRDVLAWFRKRGRGYQTRINQLLRKYMEAHK